MTSWVPCETCGGSGCTELSRSDHTCADNPCLSCSGLGELPSDGLVEAAAVAISGSASLKGFAASWKKWYRSQARAALVAARKWEREK